MDSLTAFGLLSVTAMLVFYALEDCNPAYILAFAGACALASIYGFIQGAWPFGVVEAGACALASIYGFIQGAWPFGVVEAIWALIAAHRWRKRVTRPALSE